MAFFSDNRRSRSGRAAAEKRVYVAFDTTTDAMACRDAFSAAGIEGRLVSVPREISAGCGYAWRSPLDQRASIDAHLATATFAHIGVWEL